MSIITALENVNPLLCASVLILFVDIVEKASLGRHPKPRSWIIFSAVGNATTYSEWESPGQSIRKKCDAKEIRVGAAVYQAGTTAINSIRDCAKKCVMRLKENASSAERPKTVESCAFIIAITQNPRGAKAKSGV